MRNMWLEQGYERAMQPDSVTQKQGCVIMEDVVLEGDTWRVKTGFTPYRFQFSVCLNVPRCHQARPEASAVHQQLLAPAASLSICRVIASNQGPQQTNPDRYSHLRFTLGQLWCHPKGGGGQRGGSLQSV